TGGTPGTESGTSSMVLDSPSGSSTLSSEPSGWRIHRSSAVVAAATSSGAAHAAWLCILSKYTNGSLGAPVFDVFDEPTPISVSINETGTLVSRSAAPTE